MLRAHGLSFGQVQALARIWLEVKARELAGHPEPLRDTFAVAAAVNQHPTRPPGGGRRAPSPATMRGALGACRWCRFGLTHYLVLASWKPAASHSRLSIRFRNLRVIRSDAVTPLTETRTNWRCFGGPRCTCRISSTVSTGSSPSTRRRLASVRPTPSSF